MRKAFSSLRLFFAVSLYADTRLLRRLALFFFLRPLLLSPLKLGISPEVARGQRRPEESPGAKEHKAPRGEEGRPGELVSELVSGGAVAREDDDEEGELEGAEEEEPGAREDVGGRLRVWE